MALLGMKKKQAFGMMPPVGPYNTPGIGDGINMGQDAPGMMPQPMPQAQPAKFKPNILGVIGDAMQVFGGGQATYMNGVREQQERAEQMRQRAMMAQQERETGWQDWVKKKEYERANPDPVNNDTVNDLNWYKGLSEEDRKLYHQMKPVVGYMADGTPRIVNPMEVGQANRAPAPGTVEDGHEFIGGNPADPKSWRKVGGQPGGNSPFVQ